MLQIEFAGDSESGVGTSQRLARVWETVDTGWISRKMTFSTLAVFITMSTTITVLVILLNSVSTLGRRDSRKFLAFQTGRRGWSISRLTVTRFTSFTTIALFSGIEKAISAYLGDNGNSFAE